MPMKIHSCYLSDRWWVSIYRIASTRNAGYYAFRLRLARLYVQVDWEFK